MAAIGTGKSSGTGSTDRRSRPTKLFIGGLTRHTTTKTLHEHFCSYGSVLDCVAMRMADGRPRGFGYVTIDSPAAADRILAVPQVIDGRVVDMKRAVPEGSGTTPQGAAKLPKDRFGLGQQEPMRVPEPAFSPWSDAQYACSSAATFLGTTPMALPQTGHFIASAPVAPGQGCSHLQWSGSPLEQDETLEAASPLALPARLSAGAAEFIPSISVASSVAADKPVANDENASEPSSRAASAVPRQITAGALGDITNLANDLGDLNESKLYQTESKLSSQPPALSRKVVEDFEIHVDSCDEETGKATAVTADEFDAKTAGLSPLLGTSYPGMPPCLPPGLADMWEPDGETSPLCVSSFTGTPLSSAPGVGSLLTPHAGGLVLSTTPWSISAPQSAAATPLGSATRIMPLTADAFEPVIVAEKLSADASLAVVKNASVETCTIGTQTEECSIKLCSKCQHELSGATKSAKMLAAQGGA